MKNKNEIEDILETILEEEESQDIPSDMDILEDEEDYHKNHIKIIVAILIGLILLLVSSLFILSFLRGHFFTKEKAVISVQKDIDIGENSRANVEKTINNDLLDMYRYVIQGNYYAESSVLTDKNITFEFLSDGTFNGYTQADETDFGTYELEAQGDEILLTVKGMCEDTEDIYIVGMDKEGNTTLTAKDIVYTLKLKK